MLNISVVMNFSFFFKFYFSCQHCYTSHLATINPSIVFYYRSSSVRQGSNFTNDRVKPSFQTSTVTVYNKFKKKVDQKYLEVGQNVMCIHNKEMATVKYVGHTEFATGVWVGLEMKKKIGTTFDIQ